MGRHLSRMKHLKQISTKATETLICIKAAWLGQFFRTSYIKVRWTMTSKDGGLFVEHGATEVQRKEVAERLVAHVANCVMRATTDTLWTELGRLADARWTVSAETLDATRATVLVEIGCSTTNLRQFSTRIFWLPTRGWPGAKAVAKTAYSRLRAEPFRIMKADNAGARTGPTR